MAILTAFSSTNDGFLQKDDATYATANAAATADTATTNSAATVCCENSPSYTIRRSGFFFDTSSIPVGSTIESAVLTIVGSGSVNDTDNDKVNVYSLSAGGTLTTDDFGDFGTTPLSTEIDIGSWDSGGDNDFTLNASGIAGLVLGGTSELGLRLTRDVSANQPTGNNSITCVYADTGGATRPKLVVTHFPFTPGIIGVY